MTDIRSLIECIFKENLRLVCKECGHGGVEVCDCLWMVKPGCIEECAKKAAEALSLTVSPPPKSAPVCPRCGKDRVTSCAGNRHCLGCGHNWTDVAISPLAEEIASAMAGLVVIRDSTVKPELRDYVGSATAVLERLARENEHHEKVIAARDEQLTKEINATRHFVEEIERLARHNGVLKAHVQSNMDRADELARENERLKGQSVELQRAVQAQAIRIRELEAERDRCRETNQVLMGSGKMPAKNATPSALSINLKRSLQKTIPIFQRRKTSEES